MKVGSIKFDRPIDQVLKGKINPYAFEVGILKDGPHFAPVERETKKTKQHLPAAPNLKQFAGGPARKQSRKVDGTLNEVGASIRKNSGINYLTVPFKNQNDDAVRMLKGFWSLVFGEGKLQKKKRFENLLQACVRNPILRGTYGRNKQVTARIKGFNRKFIDTSQFFKSITAKLRITSKVGK